MKLSFKMRILIPSIIVVLLAFSVTGIIVYETMNSAIEKLAMENMSNLSHSYGNTIQTYIGEALSTASIMASSAETFTHAQTPREEVSAFVASILQKNPTLVDAIIVWEPNAFDGKDNEFAGSNTIGTTPEGRFAPMSDRSSGSISSSFAKHIATGSAASTWYDQPLKSGKAFISDPSTHTFDGKDITTITVSVPFKSGERVLGVASIDISMDIISDMIKKLEVYQTGYPFLLSNSFVTIAHHNADRIGRISDMAAQIAEPVAQNKDFLTKKFSAVSGKYSYTMYTPVPIKGTDYKFVFCISAPQKEVLAASDKVRDAILIVALLSVICVSFLLTLLVKRLMKLLGGEPQDVLQAIHKVSQGDFTVDITSKSCEPDSIAGSVQCMMETFKGIITEIIDISEKLKVSSGELSAGAQELSSGVSNQAERAMQISAASSEMAATTEDIARNLTDISTFANQTAEKTVNGDRVVNNSLQSISQIKNTVEHSFQLVNSLGEKSKGISDIVNVISDIADQTNLLALNAAIEAARVGEAGRGFAVVADEVRKLAERTQHATSEISTLVASTLSEVDNVIQSMDGVAGKVNAGVESSKQITVVLKDIEGGVSQLQSMVENISTATQEMSATSNQVQQDIDSVASVSTQVSATSDHLAKNASSLESISMHLRTMMTRFVLKKS